MATARYSPAMRSCLYTCRNNMTTTSSTTTTSTTSRTGAISTSLRPSFSTSAWLSGGGSSHESHYNPPTGWLWGIPPGQKYEKEGWEGLMYWGYCGGIGLAMIAYIYKPDTSIQTWALEEARRRLEAEGILPDPDDNDDGDDEG